MNLFDTGNEAYRINATNGFDVLLARDFPGVDDSIGEARIKAERLAAQMALVHSEVSEACEAVRKMWFENFAEEMADVVIRVTSICYGLGIDLDAEVASKLEKNKSREHRHGGKLI